MKKIINQSPLPQPFVGVDFGIGKSKTITQIYNVLLPPKGVKDESNYVRNNRMMMRIMSETETLSGDGFGNMQKRLQDFLKTLSMKELEELRDHRKELKIGTFRLRLIVEEAMYRIEQGGNQ